MRGMAIDGLTDGPMGRWAGQTDLWTDGRTLGKTVDEPTNAWAGCFRAYVPHAATPVYLYKCVCLHSHNRVSYLQVFTHGRTEGGAAQQSLAARWQPWYTASPGHINRRWGSKTCSKDLLLLPLPSVGLPAVYLSVPP